MKQRQAIRRRIRANNEPAKDGCGELPRINASTNVTAFNSEPYDST